jgi:galactokinase/mevalonate kinase-like predicted kinase
MKSQWENWKGMSEGQWTHPAVEELFAASAHLVEGARLNGAGGGGVAMFLIQEGRRDDFIRLLRRLLGARAAVYRWRGLWC